ncbi:stretch-activated cation channel mid1 [Tulasnella sp. 424]|nr:stretch-activated cation channel mid1 [Tulasnella sp. 424]
MRPSSIPWPRLKLLGLLLVLPVPILAQVGTQIGIPSLNSFTIQSSTSTSMFFSLPPSGPEVTISVAFCSNNQPLPRFFVSTISGPNTMGPNDPNSQEITFQDGVGWWTGEVQSGASVAAFVGSGAAKNLTWTFEIGVQEGESPAHGPAADPPTLGDTTATQAIVFSPAFETITNLPVPKWPNYTLPALRPTFQPPAFVVPHSIVILPTPSTLNTFPFYKSACALRELPEVTQAQEQFNASAVSIVRDPSFGWQTQFLIPSGLKPNTNYTVWVTQGPKISGPVYMYTKSASFSDSCVLVHSLSYCPMVSYPIPLPASSISSTSSNSTPIVDEDTLPAAIANNITSSLNNFATLLSTFPCGRDVYSPLHGCADCYDAYRVWACFVSFPRCTEPLPGSPTTPVTSGSSSTVEPQIPFALKPRPAQSLPRAAGFPPPTTAYTELLPCIESCQTVRRTCPPFLGWSCPVPDVNAAESYALGVWDSWNGLIPGGGLLGQSDMGNGTVSVTDRFGRIWCNGV